MISLSVVKLLDVETKAHTDLVLFALILLEIFASTAPAAQLMEFVVGNYALTKFVWIQALLVRRAGTLDVSCDILI